MKFEDPYSKYPVSKDVEISDETRNKIDRLKAKKIGIGVFDVFKNQNF